MAKNKEGEFATMEGGRDAVTRRDVSITFLNEEDGELPIVVTIKRKGMLDEVIRFPVEVLETLGS